MTRTPFILLLAACLRIQLMELVKARNAVSGKEDNKELLYFHITGITFKQNVQTVAESFKEQLSELNSEKTAMNRIWKKRENEIAMGLKKSR